jgi:hypothetical protein
MYTRPRRSATSTAVETGQYITYIRIASPPTHTVFWDPNAMDTVQRADGLSDVLHKITATGFSPPGEGPYFACIL